MAPPDSSFDGPDGTEDLSSLGAAGDDDLMQCFEDLTPFEVEHFVQDLQAFKLEEVGASRWLTQHERVEKLNWTAHNQAKEGIDEYVVDQLNTQEKVPMLIYDLILTEVWKEQIWPLVKDKIVKFSSLRTYIPLYHEASVSNLLEVCLFHRTSCEEAGDALVDLVDFCIRKLRYLLATPNDKLVHQVTDVTDVAEWDSVRLLDEQFAECEFQVAMCVISIIRFLTDHRVAVPLAVTTRLLETHDVLLLLVPLMEKAPWVRKNKLNGRIEKFEENKWQPVEAADEGRLPKLHVQVWLAIYNLMMDAECRGRYELTSIRRENLLRLRRYINEVVVDQLPPLSNLHRTLEELSITGQFTGASANPASATFVLELVAEAREALIRTYEGRWQEVADLQLKEVLVKETPEELKRLNNMIAIPKELFEAPVPHMQEGGSLGASSARTSAWEALVASPIVRSTASFFAAVSAQHGPLDEVVVLSAPSQPVPPSGEKLRLELRRTRQSLLGGAGPLRERAAAGADLAARRAVGRGQEFSLAIEAAGVSPTSVRILPFVSQKGNKRTAQELLDLLAKPGREELLRMYSEDIVEFSVPVTESHSQEGVDLDTLRGLGL